MTISIRAIKREDLPAVIELMREFAAYEDLTDYFDATVHKLEAAMFGAGGFVEGLTAEADSGLLGYALFYPCFASFRGERGIYLEDIYVQQEHRRGGAGLLMLKEIARLAAERGMVRMDFQVLDWNRPAIEFYRKHGAVSNHDETHFKFSDEAFRSLAS